MVLVTQNRAWGVVELARALATGPSLLLLDEVLAGLNPTETEAAVALLQRIHARGVSMILIDNSCVLPVLKAGRLRWLVCRPAV